MSKRTTKSSQTQTSGEGAASAPSTPPPKATNAGTAAKPPRTIPATPKPRAAASKTGKGARARMSGLDAAAKVLADAGKPMRCAEIIERIIAKRLWSTKGRTPAATINAAMLREVRGKGKASRFRKAGRGHFVATGKGR